MAQVIEQGDTDELVPPQGVGHLLNRVATGFTMLGGLTFCALIVMSIISIVGRKLFSAPVRWDAELMPMGAAVGAAAFLSMNHGDFNAQRFTRNNVAYARLSNNLAVIPLFMLMGQFATNGGLSRALFRCAAAFIGHFRGDLAMAATGACAGFGAICGPSLATAATMGQVALPELRAHGCSGRLATNTLAAAGTPAGPTPLRPRPSAQQPVACWSFCTAACAGPACGPASSAPPAPRP